MSVDMDHMLNLLKRLSDAGVEYVLVGGMAAIAHGGCLVTRDVDVCAPLDESNIQKILKAFEGLHPTHRMRPDKLPLAQDPERFRGFKNLNVLTELGIIDILGELPGWGSYDDALRHSVSMNFDGFACRVLDLDALIAVKRAAGRPKDLRAVTELESLLRYGPQNPFTKREEMKPPEEV